MIPQRIVRFVIGRLMAAVRECFDFSTEASDIDTIMFYSTKGNQFGLNAPWRVEFKRLATRCSAWLDQYPIEELDRFLQTLIADAKEDQLNSMDTSACFQKKLEMFFKRIETAPEWAVVQAVFGISITQKPFELGPCRFFIMDEAELFRWAQRRRCARYDPPPEIEPFFDRFRLDEHLLNNWVGCIRVRAIDGPHATAKARYRLEEVLNVLRHGTFHFATPHQCVRAGLGYPHFWGNQAMGVAVDPGRGFQESAGQGANGLSIESCQYVSQAWKPINDVVLKESPCRTSLESTIMTAVEWVGQAAAAPLGPVRIVSLVTALEVLVIDDSEILGKRSKLSKRVAAILKCVRTDTNIEETADRLYQVRSECLHEGATQVEKDDIETAFFYVDGIIAAFLTKEPFCKFANLAEVLDAIREPEGPFIYTI